MKVMHKIGPKNEPCEAPLQKKLNTQLMYSSL